MYKRGGSFSLCISGSFEREADAEYTEGKARTTVVKKLENLRLQMILVVPTVPTITIFKIL